MLKVAFVICCLWRGQRKRRDGQMLNKISMRRMTKANRKERGNFTAVEHDLKVESPRFYLINKG